MNRNDNEKPLTLESKDWVVFNFVSDIFIVVIEIEWNEIAGSLGCSRVNHVGKPAFKNSERENLAKLFLNKAKHLKYQKAFLFSSLIESEMFRFVNTQRRLALRELGEEWMMHFTDQEICKYEIFFPESTRAILKLVPQHCFYF